MVIVFKDSKYEWYKSSEIRGELKDDAVGQSAAIKSDFKNLRPGIKVSVKSLIVLTLPIAIFIYFIMFSTSSEIKLRRLLERIRNDIFDYFAIHICVLDDHNNIKKVVIYFNNVLIDGGALEKNTLLANYKNTSAGISPFHLVFPR